MSKQKNTYIAIRPRDYNDCFERVKSRGWCIKNLRWYLYYTNYHDLHLIYKNNRKRPSLAYTISHKGEERLYEAGSGESINLQQAKHNNPGLAALLRQLKAQHIKTIEEHCLEKLNKATMSELFKAQDKIIDKESLFILKNPDMVSWIKEYE